MKYQLWYSESERSGALLYEDDRATRKPPDARLIWEVEADNYDEARQKRDEFLERAGFSFAPYSEPDAVQELQELLVRGEETPGRHRSEQSEEQTTRVTAIVYPDDSGNEQSFEVPGWIGITSPLAAYCEEIATHLAEAGAATGSVATLKQVYIERPYGDLSAAPNEITVVTLRSADDSGMGMLQEFVGRIEDLALLSALVSRRLGASIANWRFVEYHVFKRSGSDGVSVPLEYSRQGVLHIIYTAHGSDSDFERIEADLNHVAKDCPHLVLLVEGVLTSEQFRERLDPSLRSLPSDVLFDSRTIRRHREEFARAYAGAISDDDRDYRVWNELPVARKTVADPFGRRLLAWATGRGVEIVPAETSLEAWLTHAAWDPAAKRADAAAARGDAMTMWAENRREWEMLARANRLRDADANAQITRILQAERRGHDVLYVVGALHCVNEDLLVGGLNAVVHEKRIPESIGERFIEALVKNAFDDQPAAVRERIETLLFLHDRLMNLARPATLLADVVRIVDEIEQEAAARNITLRQLVEHTIATADFQEAAGTLDWVRQRRFIAWTFIVDMINGGFIPRAEVEKYLDLPRCA